MTELSVNLSDKQAKAFQVKIWSDLHKVEEDYSYCRNKNILIIAGSFEQSGKWRHTLFPRLTWEFSFNHITQPAQLLGFSVREVNRSEVFFVGSYKRNLVWRSAELHIFLAQHRAWHAALSEDPSIAPQFRPEGIRVIRV